MGKIYDKNKIFIESVKIGDIIDEILKVRIAKY